MNELRKAIRSKSSTINILKKNKINHPETEFFSKDSFFRMIDLYDFLYIKPDNLGQGKRMFIIENFEGKFKLNYPIEFKKRPYIKAVLFGD